MTNYISLNLKYLMKEKSASRNDIAELADVTYSAVGTYVRGENNPQVDAIQRICEHFDITIDDFINRSLADLPKGVDKLPAANLDKEDLKAIALLVVNNHEQLLSDPLYKEWFEKESGLKAIEILKDKLKP